RRSCRGGPCAGRSGGGRDRLLPPGLADGGAEFAVEMLETVGQNEQFHLELFELRGAERRLVVPVGPVVALITGRRGRRQLLLSNVSQGVDGDHPFLLRVETWTHMDPLRGAHRPLRAGLHRPSLRWSVTPGRASR